MMKDEPSNPEIQYVRGMALYYTNNLNRIVFFFISFRNP